MSAESRRWLAYVQENLRVATMCLQNAQEAVEKALKALHLASGLPLKRTHSIGELRSELLRVNVDPGISEDDAELLDTVYLPSKYPLGSVLPNFEPDAEMARRCLTIANHVVSSATAKRFTSE
jgi:HEPN domain-containing protein